MANFIGDTNHPYNPPQNSGFSPFVQQFAAASMPGAPAAAPGTIVPTSTTNLPTNPGNLAAGLATDVSQSNLAASDYMKQLTDIINAENTASQQQINASRFGPEGQAITDTFLTDIGSGAKGELPADVIQQEAGLAAQRGGGGFGVDNPNSSAAMLRALGLTSLDRQSQALGQYKDLASLYPLAPLYSMQDQLVSPGTYASTQQAQNNQQQQASEFANELAFKYYQANLDAQARARGGGGGGSSPRYTGGGVTGVTGGGYGLPGYTPTSTGTTDTAPGGDYTPYDWSGGGGTLGGTGLEGDFIDPWATDVSGVQFPPADTQPTDTSWMQDYLSGVL